MKWRTGIEKLFRPHAIPREPRCHVPRCFLRNSVCYKEGFWHEQEPWPSLGQLSRHADTCQKQGRRVEV